MYTVILANEKLQTLLYRRQWYNPTDIVAIIHTDIIIVSKLMYNGGDLRQTGFQLQAYIVYNIEGNVCKLVYIEGNVCKLVYIEGNVCKLVYIEGNVCKLVYIEGNDLTRILITASNVK